jgi:hypothetical protein
MPLRLSDRSLLSDFDMTMTLLCGNYEGRETESQKLKLLVADLSIDGGKFQQLDSSIIQRE